MDAIFTIGAAARETRVCPDTIRSYEERGLITPARDTVGRRLFDARDLHAIRQARAKMLRERGKR